MKKMKYALGVLAVVLTLCLPMVAVAVESSASYTTGSSDVEGVLEKDIFKVVLPTVPETGDTTFNFHIDPRGLITTTGGTAYGVSAKDAATMLGAGSTVVFKQTDANGKPVKYDKQSNVLQIINKSSFGVTATIEASIATASSEHIAYVENLTTIATDAGVIPAEVQLNIAKYNRTVEGKVTSYAKSTTAGESVSLHSPTSAEITDATQLAATKGYAALALEIPALAVRNPNGVRTAEAYEFTYNTTTKAYQLSLKSEFAGGKTAYDFGQYNTAFFALDGAANEDSTEWEAAKADKPALTVKWTVKPTEYKVNTTALATPATNGAIAVKDGSSDLTKAYAGKYFKVVYTPVNNSTVSVKTVKMTPKNASTDTTLKEVTRTAPNTAWTTAWFTMPDDEVTISATVAPIYKATLTVASTGGSCTIKNAAGTAVVTNDTFFEGDKITVEVAPADGKVATVKFAGTATPPDTTDGNVYTYTVGAADFAIVVEFNEAGGAAGG